MGEIAAIAALAMGGAELFGASKEAKAQREAAKYQEHMHNLNARLAEGQAEDEVNRGNKEANQLARQTKALRGSQRVAYAAQGIDVNSGVAAEVQADTEALGKLDELQIRENAWRKAWGYKVEALNSRSAAGFARAAGEQAASNTLLSGGLRAMGSGIKALDYSGLTDRGGRGGKSVPKYGYDERQN